MYFCKDLFFIISLMFCSHLILGQNKFQCTGHPLGFRLDTFFEFHVNTFENENQICGKSKVTDKKFNVLAYRPTDHLIYFISTVTPYNNRPLQRQLYRMDQDGKIEFLTDVNLWSNSHFYAATITPDGNRMHVIGADLSGNMSDTLYFLSIDLTSPDFTMTGTPLYTNYSNFSLINSIVCHPLTGQIIGYDSRINQLVTIHPEVQEVRKGSFAAQSGIEVLSGLYFDPFGSLIAIARPPRPPAEPSVPPNNIYKFDGIDGLFKKSSEFRIADDICSCPYIVAVEQTVSPQKTFACTEVKLTYRIGNQTGINQTDMVLVQQLPDGFEIREILYNGLGGNVISGVGTNTLKIENLDMQNGGDSIVLRVYAGALAAGDYDFQARLSGIREKFSEDTFKRSDNPLTCEYPDPTRLKIIPLNLDLSSNQTSFCKGQSLLIKAPEYANVGYLWSTGSTQSFTTADTTAWYHLTIFTECGLFTDSLFVTEADVLLDLGQNLSIDLGDQVSLRPEIETVGSSLSYEWHDLQDTTNVLFCSTCPTISIQPFENQHIGLYIFDEFGCRGEDDIKINVRKVYEIFMPNVLHASVDSKFYPKSKSQVKVVDFEVYDRWGNKVYKASNFFTNDDSFGWDGNISGSNGVDGVYTWSVIAEFIDNTFRQFYGNVLYLK